MALEYSSSYSLLPQLIITPSFFIFLIFLLYSISLFHVTSASASTPTTSLFNLKVEQDQEALTLLTWKASLDNQTQSFLSSWSGRNSCQHWFGVTCHKSGSVSNLDLDSCGLRELAYTMKVDNKTDVYSFSVVIMEVIMGKHPGELVSSLLSSSSSSSTSPSIVDQFLLNDVMDQRPSPPLNQVAEEVEVAVKLAFACLRVNLQSCPTMQQVAQALSTQWPPLSKLSSIITLGELQGHGHGGETS